MPIHFVWPLGAPKVKRKKLQKVAGSRLCKINKPKIKCQINRYIYIYNIILFIYIIYFIYIYIYEFWYYILLHIITYLCTLWLVWTSPTRFSWLIFGPLMYPFHLVHPRRIFGNRMIAHAPRKGSSVDVVVVKPGAATRAAVPGPLLETMGAWRKRMKQLWQS